MKEMKLIDGLFPGKTGSQRAANAAGEPKTALTTKRTFKISNDLWDDFVALAAAKKLTLSATICHGHAPIHRRLRRAHFTPCKQGKTVRAFEGSLWK